MADTAHDSDDRTDDVTAPDDITEEFLVEEVSIDGMCGVY
ncbi:MAG: mycofactocin precursor MftA [Actinobacteria bacterium]|nr:mycofactocin precursor MftA [Actinomycetota bacterium]